MPWASVLTYMVVIACLWLPTITILILSEVKDIYFTFISKDPAVIKSLIMELIELQLADWTGSWIDLH